MHRIFPLGWGGGLSVKSRHENRILGLGKICLGEAEKRPGFYGKNKNKVDISD